MNLFELFVKIGVDDQASGKLSDLSSKLGNGLKTAAKIGTAAVGAAAAGITALTTAAVNNYAEYEQLVGGVETLFKESADTVKKYASDAYKSAGLSANEYMSTVTGFSASLLQSLGRGAQTDLDALKENLDEQYKATKKSWQDKIKIIEEFSPAIAARYKEQMDAELKALKKANEEKLAEAEAANNKSVVTAETQAMAADLANQAVIDMADNAAKMGTSMEMIQNAYAGFAKQNYTMLDNLKLGYGGTQSEMQRLIKDAAALDSSIDANSMSFANIVKAINVVQTEMGITGTTALEAGRTISGSVGAMKSAWTNLLTGLADGNADIGELVNNLVTTIVGDGTENNLGVIGNVLPAIETALGGIAKLIEGAAPKIIEILPGLVDRVVPSVISAATGMVNAVIAVLPDLLNTVVDALIQNAPALITAAIGLVQSLIQGIQENYQILVDGAIQIVTQLTTGILNMLPQIIALGLDLIVSLANGISESLPELIPTIVDVVLQIVNTLTSPGQLKTLLNAALTLVLELTKGIVDAVPNLIDAALQLVNNLIDFILDENNLNSIIDAALEIILVVTEGLVKAIPQLVDAAIQIIEKLCDFFLDPENIAMLLDMAFDIVSAIAEGLVLAIPELIDGAFELIDSLIDSFINTDWLEVGKNIVSGIGDGIKGGWKSLKDLVGNSFNSLVDGAKNVLDIHSPSRVFAGIGKNMALGVGEGWEDEFGDIHKDIDRSLAFDSPDFGISSSLSSSGVPYGGTSIGDIYITIEGANYRDEQALAKAVSQEIKNMIDMRGMTLYA